MKFFKDIIDRYFRTLGSEYYSLLGYEPVNEALYKEAFTHRSMHAHDKRGRAKNNERLEYLGDAVLELIVSDMLYKQNPDYDEGQLTSMRSLLVKRNTLNILGRKMRLQDYMSERTRYANVHILGNAFEALVGAIYLDKGYKTAQKFVMEAYEKHIKVDKLERVDKNYKSLLLEWCQHVKFELRYEVLDQTMLENNEMRFQVRAIINDRIMGYGIGRNKRQAEQAAAKQAYQTVSRKGVKSVEAAQYATPKTEN